MKAENKKQVAAALLQAASALEEINAYGWGRQRTPEQRKEAARKAAETRRKRQIKVDIIVNGKKLAGIIPVYGSKPSEDYITPNKASLKKIANLEMERSYRYTDDYAWDAADDYGKGARAKLGDLLPDIKGRGGRAYFRKGNDGKWELTVGPHSNESWRSVGPLRIEIRRKEKPSEIDFGGLAAKVLKASKALESGSAVKAARAKDLSFRDLSGQNLQRAKLQGADLTRANLQGANLRGANLRGANLEGANLQGANLRGADLPKARLTVAKLQGANLQSADLRGADLVGATYDDKTIWPEGFDPEASGALKKNPDKKIWSRREDLGQKQGKSLASTSVQAGSLRRMTKVPEDEDSMTQRFFETLLKNKLQIGYDEDTQEGKIALKEFGDLGFSFASNNPAVYIWIGPNRQDNVKLDLGIAEEAILLLVETMKKVSRMS